MMGCTDVLALSQRFIDLDLAPAEEAELRRHLAECPACRAELEAREPILALARRMADGFAAPDADGEFAAEVIAGVHQRALERRLHRRRPGWWAAAAAVVVALLGGGVMLRSRPSPAPAVVAVHAPTAAEPSEPAFIEVQGEGVRVYQLASPGSGATQVAFIVDPHLEL